MNTVCCDQTTWQKRQRCNLPIHFRKKRTDRANTLPETEHYVDEPGVRVVRLQNIDEGTCNDTTQTFVSERHTGYLVRNQVKPGDVLIAGLGEDNNVVGRACCYPDGLPPAINKADCFRLRCNSKTVLNAYLMFFLNTAFARHQIRRYEQGVTRLRINTGNLKRVCIAIPPLTEQKVILQVLQEAESQITTNNNHLGKLRQKTQALMHDLLTRRVRVKVEEPATPA